MERDCQTIPTISDNGFEYNLDNWEQLFQGAGRTTPPGERRTNGAAGARDGWSTLKTMKTASRTWKSGREVDVQSGRGRATRLLSTSPPAGRIALGNKKNKKDDKTSGGQKGQTIPTISTILFETAK